MQIAYIMKNIGIIMRILWFGTTALPQYGVKFPTEDELKAI